MSLTHDIILRNALLSSTPWGYGSAVSNPRISGILRTEKEVEILKQEQKEQQRYAQMQAERSINAQLAAACCVSTPIDYSSFSKPSKPTFSERVEKFKRNKSKNPVKQNRFKMFLYSIGSSIVYFIIDKLIELYGSYLIEIIRQLFGG